ncbi:hypothetical protein TrLO_g2023 [Triparma laevis f. longispina]|uniref:CASTOR ACT domain-containing protein n=1 Tax=Triparma laevis f. longispina TaxID=1714387 RepID=A0A9W7FBQ0_9STRA|nr:hypothetical protein TrLO_g2023 [Triparma laevis f. longispina]
MSSSKRNQPSSPTEATAAKVARKPPTKGAASNVKLTVLPESYVRGRFDPKEKMTLSKLATSNLAKFIVVDPTTPFFLNITPTEVSLVCSEDDASNWGDTGVKPDPDWKVFQILSPTREKNPTSALALIPMLTSHLAMNAIPHLVQSTFETDYILVKENNLVKAATAFAKSGYDVDVREAREEDGEESPSEDCKMS